MVMRYHITTDMQSNLMNAMVILAGKMQSVLNDNRLMSMIHSKILATSLQQEFLMATRKLEFTLFLMSNMMEDTRQDW